MELADVLEGRGGGFAIRGWVWSVSGAGDVNGDGLPDLAVASHLADAHYPSLSGASYVIFGQPAWRGLEPRFRRGAVRGREGVNISDAIALLGYLFLGGEELACLDAADADDSGRINITDAVRILRFLFLGGDPPPAPGPANCGADPTEDDLGCDTQPGDCAQ